MHISILILWRVIEHDGLIFFWVCGGGYTPFSEPLSVGDTFKWQKRRSLPVRNSVGGGEGGRYASLSLTQWYV